MDKRTLLFIFVFTVALFFINVFFSNERDDRARVEAAKPAPVVKVEEPVAVEAPSFGEGPEKFFVLENAYQQLVFSNYGGALAEINLPFESETNEVSVVKEIGFDRTMEEDFPWANRFPNQAYYTAGMVEHPEGNQGGYYPLIRRDLMGENGKPEAKVPPAYYATNIVSQYPELANLIYSVDSVTENEIVFTASSNGRTITKKYTLPADSNAAPYVLDLEVTVDGDRDLVRGLWLTSGVPEVELLGAAPAPALKMHTVRGGKSEVEKLSKPKPGQPITMGSIHPKWLSNANGFFGVIANPTDEVGAGYRSEFVPPDLVVSRLAAINRSTGRFKPAQLAGYQLLVPLNSSGGTMTFRLFAGPYSSPILRTVDRTFTDPSTGVNPRFIEARSFHGYFKIISKPFSKFLFVIMNFFHTITHSWAAAIILLTVVLRLMLFPLSTWSFKSMRRMQQIQPEVKKLQAKYKKDPRRAQSEVLQLYRKKKVNPFSGCLPIIIQMPFLIGMFDLLRSTFALRGAPFIPGWIDNLTAPDVLFSWSSPIFFFGTEFHLLPILLGAVMFFQQRLSSNLPKDKSTWTDQQKQQRMMGNVMMIVFAVMFYNFPSGLNLYWLSSMLLGMLQQWVTNKRMDKTPLGSAKATA